MTIHYTEAFILTAAIVGACVPTPQSRNPFPESTSAIALLNASYQASGEAMTEVESSTEEWCAMVNSIGRGARP
jgi:hypothetical protein